MNWCGADKLALHRSMTVCVRVNVHLCMFCMCVNCMYTHLSLRACLCMHDFLSLWKYIERESTKQIWAPVSLLVHRHRFVRAGLESRIWTWNRNCGTTFEPAERIIMLIMIKACSLLTCSIWPGIEGSSCSTLHSTFKISTHRWIYDIQTVYRHNDSLCFSIPGAVLVFAKFSAN